MWPTLPPPSQPPTGGWGSAAGAEAAATSPTWPPSQTEDGVTSPPNAACALGLFSGGVPVPSSARLSACRRMMLNETVSGSDPTMNSSDLYFTTAEPFGVQLNNNSLVNVSCYEFGNQVRRSDISWDDATWILTSSFIIFTMQSGFGLLESGVVSSKNEVNIMVKNVVDVIFGGVAFWMFGFGIVFDDELIPESRKNPFSGVGPFFVDADDAHMGYIFSCFIFQLSFATTATTIVSGAMAERTKLSAYIVFSFVNTVVYAFPAYWIWAEHGFLRLMGAVDIAGAGAVHLVGGTTGLVATVMLKPRIGKFGYGMEGESEKESNNGGGKMGCPTNALLGMFMLWWGWLGFNCGSTFGISGGKWKLAARSAVATVLSSMGGGTIGLLYSYVFKQRKFDVTDLVNGILSALVSVTAICAIAHPWESIVIGAIGAMFACITPPILERMRIDDPVGVIPVHGISAIWSMLAVGLFAQEDKIQCLTGGRRGLFRGGGFYLLGIQALSIVVIVAWSVICSILLLGAINLVVGTRMSAQHEEWGADYVEHGLSPLDRGLVTTLCTIDRLAKTPRHSSTASPRPTHATNNGHLAAMQQENDDSARGSLGGSTGSPVLLTHRRRSLGLRRDTFDAMYRASRLGSEADGDCGHNNRNTAAMEAARQSFSLNSPPPLCEEEHAVGNGYLNPEFVAKDHDIVSIHL